MLLFFIFLYAGNCIAQHIHSGGEHNEHDGSSSPKEYKIVNPLADTLNERVYYTCSMHPEIKLDKAGQCPKCGMNLEMRREKMKKTPEGDTKVSYICPMHSDVKSNKKGKCSKCGMNLKKEKEYIYK